MAELEIETPQSNPLLNLVSRLNIKDESDTQNGIEYLPDEECFCEKHKIKYIAHVEKWGDEIRKTQCPKCEEEWHEKKRKAAEEQSRKEREIWEREQKRETAEKLGLNPMFYFSELSDYKANTKAQELAKKACEKMIQTHKGKIILLGNHGTGKTMLANIVARELQGRVYLMYQIAARIRRSYTAGGQSELDIVDELVKEPFLAIDEVGKVTSSEAVRNWFSYILDGRYSRNLPTMLIGNLHFKRDCEKGGCPQCFENYFENDVLSRFHEDTVICEIMTDDERKKSKTLEFVSDRRK